MITALALALQLAQYDGDDFMRIQCDTATLIFQEDHDDVMAAARNYAACLAGADRGQDCAEAFRRLREKQEIFAEASNHAESMCAF